MAQLYFDREAAMRKLRDDAYLLDRAHAVLQHQLAVGFCECEVSKKYSELMMRLSEKEPSNNGEQGHKSMILALAENYYTVAGHLRQEIARMAEAATLLEQMADRMCEHNIRQQSSASGESNGKP